jgi:hypothetical protein
VKFSVFIIGIQPGMGHASELNSVIMRRIETDSGPFYANGKHAGTLIRYRKNAA